MKFLVLILFCTFVFQSDTTKVDTIVVHQAHVVQKKLDNMNNKLDSLFSILAKDTINKKH